MDQLGPLVVAIAVIAIILVVARRYRDRPGDRGPYSTAMETRGDMAAIGKTIQDEAGGDEESRDS